MRRARRGQHADAILRGQRHPLRRGLKIVTAGAPPSPAVIRAAEEIGADVAHAYGLTETYGPHTICAWQPEWDALPVAERAQIKARQGVPYVIAGTDLRVVDPHMATCPRDGTTMGEVIMRGNNVMLGYYNNPEATDESVRGRLVPFRRPRGDASATATSSCATAPRTS